MSSENRQQDPFLIRGHHLYHYEYLLYEYGQLGSTTKAAHKETESWRSNLKFEPTNYQKDILGHEMQNHRYWINHENLYIRFLEIPDNSTVQLTTFPDEIYNLCVIGEHCKKGRVKREDRAAIKTIFGPNTVNQIIRAKYLNMTMGELKQKLLESLELLED